MPKHTSCFLVQKPPMSPTIYHGKNHLLNSVQPIFIKYLQEARISHLFSLPSMDSFYLDHVANSHSSNKFSHYRLSKRYVSSFSFTSNHTSYTDFRLPNYMKCSQRLGLSLLIFFIPVALKCLLSQNLFIIICCISNWINVFIYASDIFYCLITASMHHSAQHTINSPEILYWGKKKFKEIAYT